MTLRELVFLVLDEVKINSDDSYFNEDHIEEILIDYILDFIEYDQYDKTMEKEQERQKQEELKQSKKKLRKYMR